MNNKGIILSQQTYDRMMAATMAVERLLGGGRRGIAGFQRRDEGAESSVILCRLVTPLTGVGYGKYNAKSLRGASTLEPAGTLDMPEGMTVSSEIDVLFANLPEDGLGVDAHLINPLSEVAWGIGVHVGTTEEGLKRVIGVAITIGCLQDEEVE